MRYEKMAWVKIRLNISTKLAYRLVKQRGFPLVPLSNKAWRIPRDAFFARLGGLSPMKEREEYRIKHDLEGYEPNFGCPKTFLM